MDLSVIIVNFNTRKLLKDCLDSIFKHSKGTDFEVIVVDNASTDESPEMVKKEFPQIKLIENRVNLGFAKANNQAMKIAKGQYILLLNSDTKLRENSFKIMLEFMGKNPKIGISSCQLVDEKGLIQASGGFFPTLPRVFAWMFFLDDLPGLGRLIRPFHPHEPDFYTGDPWYKSEHFQDWVTGAFFLIRNKVINEIGFLDEKFFMYVEEMECCFRAKQAGWQIAYTPVTKVVHFGRKSGTSEGAILGEYKGLKYFFTKHMGSWRTLVLRILLRAGAILRILVFGIIMRDAKAGKIYAKAFWLA